VDVKEKNKKFLIISQMVQDLSHWQTINQTNRQTDIHTPTNRHYWKQYHFCYVITAEAV